MDPLILQFPSAQPVRIVALGDCNTHTGNPKQGTVPEGVAWAFRNAGIPAEVTNLGGGMETCREGLARLRNTPTSADIAVINFGLVDAWTTSIPQLYVPYYPDNLFRKPCRKLLKFAKRRLLTTSIRKLLPSGPVVKEEEFTSRIGQMIETLRERSATINIFIWGTVPVSNHDSRNIPLYRYNKLLSQIAASHDATFVDSESLVSHITIEERHLDGVHISPAVARTIGTEIFTRHMGTCSAPVCEVA